MDDTTKQADSAAPAIEADLGDSKNTGFGVIRTEEASSDNATAEQSSTQSQEKEAPVETAKETGKSQPKEQDWESQIPEKFKGDKGKFVKAYLELEKARTEDRQALSELKALKEKVDKLTPAQQGTLDANIKADVQAAKEAGYFDNLDDKEADEKVLDMMAKSTRRTMRDLGLQVLQTREAEEILVPKVLKALENKHKEFVEQQKAKEAEQKAAIASECEFLKKEYPDEDWAGKEIWEAVVKELEADKSIRLETAYHRVRNKRAAKEAPAVLGASKGGAPELENPKLSGAEKVDSLLDSVLSKPRTFGPSY